MSFPRYPKYKHSGVEWLGEVPEGWKISRLGFESWVRARLGWKGLKAEEYVDDGFVFLSTPNIKPICIDFEDVNYIDAVRYEESPEIKLRVGDVLLAKDGSTLGTVNVVRFLPRPSTVNSSIAVITPNSSLDGIFLFYMFQSTYMDDTIQRIKGGMGVPHLFQADLNKFYIPVPQTSEQMAIAAFLDRETAKIDALVEEQRRLIELLKEKRQAVISHAVTKGLNPHAKMKPSGIEWLGDVPEHWEVMPIRYAARLESGHTPSRNHPEYWENCKRPWFTLSDIWQVREAGKDIITETSEMVSDIGLANSSARLLPKGTVMLSRTASVGFSAIMGCDMATSQDFANWVCGERLLPGYLLLVFRSMHGEFEKLKFGSTHNTIYMPDIQAFRLALPSLTEQKHIIRYVSERLLKIDSLVAEANRAIDLLQERRTALTSAAVTGKIDVRGCQA